MAEGVGARAPEDNDGINLTSEGRNVANRRHLSSGQSVTFVGSDGRECFVSLMSLREGQPGAASFKTGCSAAG